MSLMTRTAPERMTALAAAKEIEQGSLKPSALLEACLERIAEREPAVRAWAHVDGQAARRLARELDAGPSRGLLHGIPFGVKDIIDTHDQPSAYGSPIYEGHQPPWDGATAALPRSEGGILVGKTVTTEFANRFPGATRNPFDPEHTPGGSSSGSAAAVGDFHVPLAIGTQTGGSVIRPAAYCGAHGYKPTYQHFGNAGVRTNTEAFDTVGIMARSVPDLALFRAAIMQIPFEMPDPSLYGRPRIAVCRTQHWDQALAETRDAMAQAEAAFRDAGAEVSELDMPDFFAGLNKAHGIITGFESTHNYADELRRFPEKISDDFTAGKAAVGRTATLGSFREALRLGIRARRWMDERMEAGRIDALLTPSAPGEAPHGLSRTGPSIFNFMWTHLHMPAVTLPRFKGPKGLPVGITLAGRKHEDGRLLSLADWADRVLQAGR